MRPPVASLFRANLEEEQLWCCNYLPQFINHSTAPECKWWLSWLSGCRSPLYNKAKNCWKACVTPVQKQMSPSGGWNGPSRWMRATVARWVGAPYKLQLTAKALKDSACSPMVMLPGKTLLQVAAYASSQTFLYHGSKTNQPKLSRTRVWPVKAKVHVALEEIRCFTFRWQKSSR